MLIEKRESCTLGRGQQSDRKRGVLLSAGGLFGTCERVLKKRCRLDCDTELGRDGRRKAPVPEKSVLQLGKKSGSREEGKGVGQRVEDLGTTLC